MFHNGTIVSFNETDSCFVDIGLARIGVLHCVRRVLLDFLVFQHLKNLSGRIQCSTSAKLVPVAFLFRRNRKQFRLALDSHPDARFSDSVTRAH